MIARWLARETREFPATALICLSWVLVFAGMTAHHLLSGSPLPISRWLFLGFGGGGPFGDVTLNELSRGQVWRIITCNFLHFSLIHLALNVLSMYYLGSLLESWYGPYQLIYVYGLTGGVGNLLAALARLWVGSNRDVHSAGASVAIMGMVGICALAGWRSGTPEGRRNARLMVIFTALTAGLGAAFPRFIDNWGHAGGLGVGLVVGLFHHRLYDRIGKPAAWGAGVLTALVFVGSAAAQFAADRREAPARRERWLVRSSHELARASVELGWLKRSAPPNLHIRAASTWFDALEPILDPAGRADLQALRPIVADWIGRPLNDAERRALDEHLPGLLAAIRRVYEDDQRQLRELRRAR